MAGSIQFNFSAQATNGTFKDQWQPNGRTIVQNITTAPFECLASGIATTGGTAITLPVTTLGVAYIENTDTTNFFTVNSFMKVLPGEAWPLRLKPGITVTITADTASTGYVVRVFND